MPQQIITIKIDRDDEQGDPSSLLEMLLDEELNHENILSYEILREEPSTRDAQAILDQAEYDALNEDDREEVDQRISDQKEGDAESGEHPNATEEDYKHWALEELHENKQYCENTDHDESKEGEDVKEIALLPEFETPSCFWCKACRERDGGMILINQQ